MVTGFYQPFIFSNPFLSSIVDHMKSTHTHICLYTYIYILYTVATYTYIKNFLERIKFKNGIVFFILIEAHKVLYLQTPQM